MKVTVVAGGRWHAFDLARELHRKGQLHRLVTTYPHSKTRAFGIPDDKTVSLPLTLILERGANLLFRGRLDFRLQYFRHLSFALQAARHLEGSDLVHCWSSFAEPLLPWCTSRGVPLILERGSSHIAYQTRILAEERTILGISGCPTHPGVEAMELREYQAAQRIAIPSAFVRRTFLAEGVAPDRLAQNPYGVSLDHFQPGPRDSGPFHVIYAGSLSYRKGVHYLKDGFLAAGLADARLTLIGGAAPETPLLLRGQGDRISTPGHIPQAELTRRYQSADVFAIVSIEEGMAMVQAQALACGLALICSENTGGEDLLALCSDTEAILHPGGVREYPAGFVVPIRDPQAIAWCLRALYDNSGLLAAKREAALGIRTKRLDWEAYAVRAMAIHAEVLQGTG